MNLVKKVLETIIVIFVGGVATLWFFGTPELEYKSGYRDKYFNIPKAPKELTLVYRGEIIENISFFGFHIFNRTLKDISGVRLYFKMSPKGKDKVPEIISRGLLSTHSSPRGRELLKKKLEQRISMHLT